MENVQKNIRTDEMVEKIPIRLLKNKLYKGLFFFAAFFTFILLIVLLAQIFRRGLPTFHGTSCKTLLPDDLSRQA